LVWLDGAPRKDAAGKQTQTNFRASRIAPGHHVLEIKWEGRFKPWREEVEIAPGEIRKIQVTLIPAVGGPAGGKPAPIPSAPTQPDRQLAMGGTGTQVSPPTPAVQPPQPPQPPAPGPGTGSQPVKKQSGTGTNPGGGTGPATGGGAIATPGTGSTPRKKRREPTGEEGTEGGSEEPVAPRRREVTSEEGGGAGGGCSITINSVPWSEVWIDGKNTTKHTPVVDYPLPCGKHKLNFKRPDMQIDQTEPINVKAGQPFKQRYTLATDE
jgi:hypothetical protein